MTSRLCLAFLPLLAACTWVESRGRDLGDVLRVEGSVGVGLQVGVTATEVLHAGLGSSRRHSFGWSYGETTGERRVEDHLPLSFVHSLIRPDARALHSLTLGDEPNTAHHRCPLIGPATFDLGQIRKPPMQFWNLEVNVMALVAGVEAGVNPAELVDFLLGWFGLDIAGDDAPESRDRRRLWIPSDPHPYSER